MKHYLMFTMLSYMFLCSHGAGTNSVLSEENDLALKMQLKILNKPYVKSFKVILASFFYGEDMETNAGHVDLPSMQM